MRRIEADDGKAEQKLCLPYPYICRDMGMEA